MGSKKQRRKDRRNTYRLIDQAWEALESGHEALADKLGQRAVESGAMNPRIWCDHGRILEQLGRRAQAERAYRNAVSLSPHYVEALSALATLLAASGRSEEALAIHRKVVALAPTDPEACAALAVYETEAPPATVPTPETAAKTGTVEPAEPAPAAHTGHIDWRAVEADLLRGGLARLPGLLDAGACQSLRDLWSQPELFEHEVSLNDARGLVAYRFFARPLPPLVRALREEVYARAAAIANRWCRLLHEDERWPASLAAFHEVCRRAGQARTTPILLRYPEGGFNAFHRDIHGSVAFPLQLAVTLGPERAAQAGGALLLLDERPGKRRVRALSTDPGDGVLFCSRDRMVRIADLYGLQPVRHAVDTVTAKERYAVGIPFHEYT